MTRKNNPLASLMRASAAECLTFVAASGTCGVKAAYADQNMWLSQKLVKRLCDLEFPTIDYNLKKVFVDCELDVRAVLGGFRVTAADGKTYDAKHILIELQPVQLARLVREYLDAAESVALRNILMTCRTGRRA